MKINNLINQCLIFTLFIVPIVPVFLTVPVLDASIFRPILNDDTPGPSRFSASIGSFVSKITVTTKSAQNISQTKATLRGEITNSKAYSVSEIWFEYGKSTSYNATTSKKNFTGNGYVSTNILNLSPCTLYYFRAVAKNGSRTSYGADRTFKTACPSLNIRISVKNLSRGDTIWYKSLKANPSDPLLFKIEITSPERTEMKNIMAKVNLASNITYLGSLKINNVSSTKNISSIKAVNIGDLSSGELKTITFKGNVAPKNNFSSGTNNLINTVLVYTSETSNTDICKVIVKTGTATQINIATQINTGITTGILNSILFPAAIAFFAIWIFKSKIIGLDKITNNRKREITKYRAEKILKRKVNQIRNRDKIV